MPFHDNLSGLLKAALMFLFLAVTALCSAQQRATEGILAFYDFSEKSGKVIKDHSGVEPSLDLEIENPQSVSLVFCKNRYECIFDCIRRFKQDSVINVQFSR